MFRSRLNTVFSMLHAAYETEVDTVNQDVLLAHVGELCGIVCRFVKY